MTICKAMPKENLKKIFYQPIHDCCYGGRYGKMQNIGSGKQFLGDKKPKPAT